MMFLLDSGQFEAADFKSDVCQLVLVDIFSRSPRKNKRIFNRFTFRNIQSTICKCNQINFR